MFNFLKTLFVRKPADTKTATVGRPSMIAPYPVPGPIPAARSFPLPSPDSARTDKTSRHRTGERHVNIPLIAVLQTLPPELKARLKPAVIPDIFLTIPLETILTQLPTGLVKTPFAELRKLAPDLFLPDSDLDLQPVSLPLGEIMSRLDPSCLPRRRAQKQVVMPQEIRSPFGDRGEGLVFSVGPTKPTPASATRPCTPEPEKPAINSVLPPALRLDMQPEITPRFAHQTGPDSSAQPVSNSTPLPIPASAALHALRGVTTTASTPAKTEPEPILSVPLATLAETWPESIHHEIAASDLQHSSVKLPLRSVEGGLKRGRVVFQWQVLRLMLHPARSGGNSPNDGISLELPLKILAPLFLAHQKQTGRPQQKTAVDESIPNLFSSLAQNPRAPSGAMPAAARLAPRLVEPTCFLHDDAPSTPSQENAESKPKSLPDTTFLSRCITPKEAVEQAVNLPGVVGALAALPDGLMVASQLPANLNAETLAAFLPHIFSKTSQCTKELRMGDLNNLHFTVGNVPWKIHRVNALFFAVFGQAGQPLPSAQLAALAADLDRKK